MTAYTKIPLGNKLFVIEWDLEVSSSEAQGDAFEALDCKLVSVTANVVTSSGDPATAKLYHTNQSDAPASPGVASDYTSNLVSTPSIPWAGSELPAPTRFVFPRLEGGASVAAAKVACLFETIA